MEGWVCTGACEAGTGGGGIEDKAGGARCGCGEGIFGIALGVGGCDCTEDVGCEGMRTIGLEALLGGADGSDR